MKKLQNEQDLTFRLSPLGITTLTSLTTIRCMEEEMNTQSPSSTKSSSSSSKMRSPKSFKIKSPKSFIKKIRSSSSLKNLSQLNGDEQNGELLLTENNINQQLGMMLEDNNIEKERDLFDEINSLYSGGSIPKIKDKKFKSKKKIQNVMEVEVEEVDVEVEEEEGSSSSSSKSKKNQLFQEYPTEEFVKRVMRIFLGGDNTYFQFSRKMLEERNVIEEMNRLIPELKRYYLKCKHKTYLDNLDTKKVITIFRQLIRIYGYRIKSTEKYHNGNKFLLYQLEKTKKKSPKRMNFVVDFD